jgi:transcriptional regulator GlxA family with amidase domain
MKHPRVIFVIAENVHPLDLAGPLQIFYETATYRIPYEIVFVAAAPVQRLSAGLQLFGLKKFKSVSVSANDIIMVPGFEVETFEAGKHKELFTFLRNAQSKDAVICSVCTGAFALAGAGLLDGMQCTTHWKYVKQLQQRYAHAKVIENKLFVSDKNIYTSAGVTTGIDLTLHILEQRHGAEFAFKLAREVVVYTRRSGDEEQQTVYMQYRNHINSQIHLVQDWLIKNLDTKIRLEQLAELIHTSPRNLTRTFKNVTGITIGQYIEKLRAETARKLLAQKLKVSEVCKKCGFKTPAHLRTALKRYYSKTTLP